jgi:hypothetical protein
MSKAKTTRSLRMYGAYLFTTKDPVTDELRTMAQDAHGKLTMKTLRQIERDGGPTAGCMAGWFFGDTKRPQSASVEAAGRALGHKRDWVPLNGAERKEVAKAAARVMARKAADRKAKTKR